MAKTPGKKLGQKHRADRSAFKEEGSLVRPENVPPEAIDIGDDNWIMPDALSVAHMIQMNQIVDNARLSYITD